MSIRYVLEGIPAGDEALRRFARRTVGQVLRHFDVTRCRIVVTPRRGAAHVAACRIVVDGGRAAPGGASVEAKDASLPVAVEQAAAKLDAALWDAKHRPAASALGGPIALTPQAVVRLAGETLELAAIG